MAAINWNTGNKQGLVSIGTHNLYLEVGGIDRIPDEPVVVIIQGLGSCSSAWAAVTRLLRPLLRVAIYDRSGLGRSERSLRPPTSGNIIQELRTLLDVTGVKPPYVFVAHSWGGVLAQEFIFQYPDTEVAGLVLVEANNESTLKLLDWRPFMNWISSNGIDIPATLNMPWRHQMSQSEWLQSQQDAAQPSHIEQAAREIAEYSDSFVTLAKKDLMYRQPPLLGFKPLVIVVGTNGMDMEKLMKAALEADVGTPEERTRFLKFAKDFEDIDYNLQAVAQRLSRNSWIYPGGDNSGHNVQMTEPEMLVKIITFVMGNASIGGRFRASPNLV
ncbi:Alpha/Beta hydrolase protein [Rhexocercosporidium sp. MPI-PUGE-AT-0058]|nr:Alpha/Beta hydrolase protein [Rhexocercosporidium sp. MPI-PUGE-AT-0058]